MGILMKVMRRSAGFFGIVFSPLAIAFCVLEFVIVVVAVTIAKLQIPHVLLEFLLSLSPVVIILRVCFYGIGGYDLGAVIWRLLLLLLLLRCVARTRPRRAVPLSVTSCGLGRRGSISMLCLILIDLVLVLLVLSIHDTGLVVVDVLSVSNNDI